MILQWQGAQKACCAIGTKLLSIDNDYEYGVLSQAICRFIYQFFLKISHINLNVKQKQSQMRPSLPDSFGHRGQTRSALLLTAGALSTN